MNSSPSNTNTASKANKISATTLLNSKKPQKKVEAPVAAPTKAPSKSRRVGATSNSNSPHLKEAGSGNGTGAERRPFSFYGRPRGRVAPTAAVKAALSPASPRREHRRPILTLLGGVH